MRGVGGQAAWSGHIRIALRAGCVVALGLVGGARVGWAFDARVAWQPVASASGYRVHVRPSGQGWPAGTDVGGLAADPDGVVRYVARGLTAGVTLDFAVSAYDGAGRESGLSNVLSLLVPTTPAATATATRTLPPTLTRTPTVTSTPVRRAVSTSTATGTATGTATRTRTGTRTQTPTRTASATPTRTATATSTATRTPTSTASASATTTFSSTATGTATSPPTVTPTRTASATSSATASAAATPTATAAASATRTAVPTQTATATLPPSATPTTTASPSATSSATSTVPAAPSPTPGLVTIWSAATVPGTAASTDANAVELGVRFTSDVNGLIRGVRFYKGAANTGTHTGSLWSSGGVRLATATFANETASGWQQVDFATPVAITAGAVYVASYHTAVGRYAIDSGYFAAAAVDNPPLHALSSAASGGNGLYVYGASAFPTKTYQSRNYWVDVVFSAEQAAAPAPTASATATSSGTAALPSSTPTPPLTPTETPTASPTPTLVPGDLGLSGQLRYYAGGGPVTGAALTLAGSIESRSPALDGSGNYAFSALPADNWLLVPSKHGDTRGAVGSLDAARVLQAVSGTTPFTPLQALACDVTGDGTVSTLDATRILQLTIGSIPSLPAADACGSEWLFVPEPLALGGQSLILPAMGGGVCTPGAIAYSPLQASASGQDFVALLLGDCTGNWDDAAAGGALRRRRDLPSVHLAPPRRARAGRWEVALLVTGLELAQAFEARVALDDPGARLETVVLPGARGALVRVGEEAGGLLRLAAAAPAARRVDPRPLAVLVVDTAGEAPPEIHLLGAVIDEQPAVVGP